MLISETGHLKLEIKLSGKGPFRKWYVWTEEGRCLALPEDTNALASCAQTWIRQVGSSLQL